MICLDALFMTLTQTLWMAEGMLSGTCVCADWALSAVRRSATGRCPAQMQE
jgi:hypothetical protein